ncbi:MAG TPA: hypothetical protein VKE40_03045, partial [Gemmataceae bacterium]|nr:hypothetical protein [Gemmataceae bacterium]
AGVAQEVTPATGRVCPPVVVPPNCPPAPVPPCEPTRPFDTTRPPSTTEPPIAIPPAPGMEPLARAPEAGGQAAGTFNPNMFGDLFGGQTRTVSLSTILSRPVNFVLTGSISPTSGTIPNTPIPYIPIDFESPVRTLIPRFPSVVVIQDNGGVASFAAPPFTSVALFRFRDTPVPLLENPLVTNALQALNPGAAAIFVPAGSHADIDNARQATDYFISQAYLVNTTQTTNLIVATPSNGGVVGRTKIAEDNSPLPRDRVILDYDFYSNTALAPNGFDVSRFSPGLEVTFLDRMASIEVRAPFASTLDATILSDGLTNRATEFGNVNVTLKALTVRGPELAVAGGVGVSLPTGPDAVVRGTDGTDIVRIENKAYVVTPFVAAAFSPSDRWFAQAWLQIAFDPMGSPVLFNTSRAGMLGVGRLHDQTLLSADVQLGYWLVRNPPGSPLRGFAPFAELHYNTALNDADAVEVGGLTIQSLNNRFDEVNLTLGAAAFVGSNLLVSAGVVLPLRGNGDKFFDYQAGVRASWFFGPTAAAINSADAGGGRFETLPTMLGRRDRAGDFEGSVQQASATGAPPDCPPGTPVGPGGLPPAIPGAVPPPGGESLARAPESGGLPPSTFNPNFFGDQIGTSLATRFQTGPFAGRVVQVPLLPRYVGLKPVDNDSPRPQDRVFFSYNGYSGVNESVNPPTVPRIRLNRETVGLERTIGDDASVAVRLPFVQTSGSSEFDASEVGDMTLVGKYALFNDPGTGTVATLGLNLTLPTGGRGDKLPLLDDGRRAPRAIFFQPWAGAVWNTGEWFAQGVTSVLLPADPVFPTAWFNSIGVGYWLYRNTSDPLVQAVVPVAEVHVNTPLTNRGDNAVVFFRDEVNVTTGVYLQFPNLSLGASVCVPLVGPRPYDVEVMASLNYRY